MAGQRSNYGKRSHSQLDYHDNGGSKRRNPGEERDSSSVPETDDTVYRYLCPNGKIGSIIGRGGEIVKQLRSESQARIRIGDSIQGCEYRVITIFSSSRKTNVYEDTGDDICPAQDALFRVHERLAADEAPNGRDYDMDSPSLTVRLLIPPDQIGCIIGKGGQIIQSIRTKTGAHVRIQKNELPPCAIPGDELLQITGEARDVRRALYQISNCLHDNPSRSQHLLASASMLPPMGQFGVSAGGPIMGPIMTPYGGYRPDSGADWASFYPPPRDESSSRDFSLRLVCLSSLIGGVIGKGGAVIKQIRQESGASIKVDSSSDEDCIIAINAREFFEDPISPTIDAAVRLQPKCSEKTERESGEISYITRFLVPSSKIGCLIGKGGSIISEMRRATRANIRILPKENLPKVASENDEMVQISGELDVARNALIQLATRLKANSFEREGALPALMPPVPYISFAGDSSDMMKYGNREGKGYGRGYSSYSSLDVDAEGYSGYGASQGGASSYGGYGNYSSGRPGSSGFSGPNSSSQGKHHGY